MALLKIDFQDGFNGDLVVVKINGEEVFNKENIKTRLEISYADSFEIDVSTGQIIVEVSLPKKKISKAYPLESSAPIYLGLSVQDDKLICKKSKDMFYYL
jgi:hypothetical protein